jgi:sugar phosphate isomerase/epimerase
MTGWPRLGAFSYGYGRGEWDRLCRDFERFGLGAVQIGQDLLDEALENPAGLAATRRRLAEAGIVVAGLAGYRNLTAPDPQRQRAHLDYLKRCLAIANALGSPVVATETGTRHPDSDWVAVPENHNPEVWGVLEAALDELLATARDHDAVLALEGYVNNVMGSHDQLAALLARYASPHLAVVLDPYNYLSVDLLADQTRVTADFLARFKPHFVLAHLKDVAAQGAEVDTPEFGTGVFQQKPYLDWLRTHRPDLPLIIEHLPWEHVPAVVARVRALL